MNTQHTPEPWIIAPKAGWVPGCLNTIKGDTNHPECPFVVSAHVSLTANASRIVACVNACKGINPEVIALVVGSLREVVMKDRMLREIMEARTGNLPSEPSHIREAVAALAKLTS